MIVARPPAPMLDRLRHRCRRARGDWEMTFNRLVAGSLILAYNTVAGGVPGRHALSMWSAALYLLLGVVLAVHLVVGARGRDARRVAALLLDLGAISFEIWIGADATAWLYPAYLWVIFGNGFRFGGSFLVLAMALGTLLFGTTVSASAFWRAQPLLSGGLVTGLVIVPLYALTLIRKLSAARLAAEDANRAKSLFLASVSHELRTPLNAIIGMGALLTRSPLDAEQRDMSGTIITAARTLLASIDSILDLSRIEAGKMPALEVEFDLAETLAQIRRMVLTQAAAKGLALGFYVSPRTPLLLLGDDRRLREILLNLLANGIKFTRSGAVTIAVDRINEPGPIARLRFEVTDTGIGIAPDARERIFENFTQADASILDRFGGTGLGLAITRQSVLLLGGTIGVDSIQGTGSTFWFELPFAAQHMPVASTEAFRSLRCLLAASDPKAAAPMVGRLTGWGVQIDRMDASDEREVLARLPAAGAQAMLLFAAAEPAARPATTGTTPGLLVEFPVVVLAPDTPDGLPDAALRALALTAISPRSSDDDLINALWLVRSRLISPAILAGQEPSAADAADWVADPASGGTVDAQAGSEPASATGALRILASDDNATNRRVLQKVLQLAGHTVTLVEDGMAALDLMTAGPFDCVIMDVNMPGMNGIEVVKHYRMGALGEPHLPVIGLTADGTAHTRQACLKVGMDECLTKPIEPPVLIAAIAAVMAAARAQHTPALPVATLRRSVAELAAHPRFRPSSGPAVDAKAIAGLLDLGGKEFLTEVVHDYLDESRRCLARLRDAAVGADVATFRTQAHAMRSSAANVGATELSRLCQPWETISADELARSGAAHVRRLGTELDRVQIALLTWNTHDARPQAGG